MTTTTPMRYLIIAAALTCAASRAHAQSATQASLSPKLRVAVADLSGSALKMQATTVPVANAQRVAGQPTGSQTTVPACLRASWISTGARLRKSAPRNL